MISTGFILSIEWFQLFVAGILAGGLLTCRLARSYGIVPRKTALALLFALPWGFAGAKALYLLQQGSLQKFPAWLESGMSLMGAFPLFLLASCLICRWLRIPGWKFLDALAPGIALGLVFVRIGCFLQGCNGGTPADLPWAVTYPAGYPVFAAQMSQNWIPPFAGQSLPVHPTQLYEALFFLGTAVTLSLPARRESSPGWLTIRFLAGYASFRFLLEFIRSDAIWHGYGMTGGQVSCLVLALVAILLATIRSLTVPKEES